MSTPVNHGDDLIDINMTAQELHILSELDSRQFGFLLLNQPENAKKKALVERAIKYLQLVIIQVRRQQKLEGESNYQVKNSIDPKTWVKLGHFHLLLEEYNKALSAYQMFFKLQPETHWQNTTFLYGLGLVYFHFNAYQWFLATGRSFRDLALTFKLGLETVRMIIKTTVILLWECLQPIHLKPPSTTEFLNIARDFYEKWNFPNTLGAIDGKHIRIKCPKNSGTMFYNYKDFYSIVLQAVADSHGKFIFVDVGGYGKQSDGGTFRSTCLYQMMVEGKLGIPPDSALPNKSDPLPYVFIGDEAYPLLTHLIKPYSRQNLNSDTEYFNSRFSRARRIIECAFGIMSAKWRLLWKPIETDENFADNIVKCLCVLHNTIFDLEGHTIPEPQHDFQTTGTVKRVIGRHGNRSSVEAVRVRDAFKQFIVENKI